MEAIVHSKEHLSKRLGGIPKIVELEKKTGIDKFYIFVTISTIALALLYAIGGQPLMVKLVGFVYPSYQSFRAADKVSSTSSKVWLAYWIVYAVFCLIEPVLDYVFSSLPMYFFVKVGFLVWCFLPSTMGAQVIYQAVMKPYIAPYIVPLDTSLHLNNASKSTD
ncbi:hypothetical protein ABG067_004243 [Albugo candida]|uniref:Receptor expression-enhancing protein n=1 Tax=Albugo candida TaxID=65357 RepID=A0A024G6C0_9STRA|nr:unnamed protein product [Albugo candida]|eukprot:CCI42223.1 unnamed protein product [Albugo candida]